MATAKHGRTVPRPKPKSWTKKKTPRGPKPGRTGGVYKTMGEKFKP